VRLVIGRASSGIIRSREPRTSGIAGSSNPNTELEGIPELTMATAKSEANRNKDLFMGWRLNRVFFSSPTLQQDSFGQNKGLKDGDQQDSRSKDGDPQDSR
jgi:hypothetical protein